MIPPSPAVTLGRQVAHASVIVNCTTIHRYRDYACRELIIRANSHACRTVRIHWNGGKWIVQRSRRSACPHPVVRGGDGGLHTLKA